MKFPDIFGRRRIAELEKANANLNRRLQEWEDEWKQRMQATVWCAALAQSSPPKVIT